jgi:hypothetical protein
MGPADEPSELEARFTTRGLREAAIAKERLLWQHFKPNLEQGHPLRRSSIMAVNRHAPRS